MAAKSYDLLSDNSKWLRMTTGIIPGNLAKIEVFPAEWYMAPFLVAILNMLIRLKIRLRDICRRAFVPLQQTQRWLTFVKKWGQDGPKHVFCQNPRWQPHMWPRYAIFGHSHQNYPRGLWCKGHWAVMSGSKALAHTTFFGDKRKTNKQTKK